MVDYPRPGPVWILAAVAWIALAASVGPVGADAVSSASPAVAVGAQVLIWVLWAAGVVFLVRPRPMGIVVLRIGGAIILQAAVAAALLSDLAPLARTTAIVGAVVSLVLQMFPSVGDRQIDGESYPGERRFAFRAPAGTYAGIALGIVVPSAAVWTILWSLGASGLSRIIAAAIAVVLVAGSLLLVRQMTVIARRAFVFAPRTVIALDRYLLDEPLAIPLSKVAEVAPAGGDAGTIGLLDLLGGTRRPWVQVVTEDPYEPPRGRQLPERLKQAQFESPPSAVGLALPVTRLDATLEAARLRKLNVALPPTAPATS